MNTKHTPGQLGDQNAEQYYRTLIESKEARSQWRGIIIPKTDAGKRKFAEKCLDVVLSFNSNRAAIAKATGSAS